MATSQLYGMSATRGARYLLRNGLDYLGYQQYERCAQVSPRGGDPQKELTDAEKRSTQTGYRESPGAACERRPTRNLPMP